MGRSVNCLSHADAVAYIAWDSMYRRDECYECEGDGCADPHAKYIGPSPECDVCDGTGENPHPDADEHDWEHFCEDLTNILQDRFPSMEEDSDWPERESFTFLSNRHAIIARSEYCGLASVSLRIKEFEHYYADEARDANIARRWVDQVVPSFLEAIVKAYPDHALVKVGTFSNGEGVYRVASKIPA